MCVGRTNGSWMGFLSDTCRAGEAHGAFRWQVRALALLSLAFLRRLTSTCLPQYESTEAWSGVQQTFMLVPNEVCSL